MFNSLRLPHYMRTRRDTGRICKKKWFLKNDDHHTLNSGHKNANDPQKCHRLNQIKEQ